MMPPLSAVNDARPAVQGLVGCRHAGATEADDDEIRLIVPGYRRGIVDDERVLDVGIVLGERQRFGDLGHCHPR
jgi:hypothetical protein